MEQNKKIKICLLGASFDVGNLGLSALAEGCIKCILNRWPDADVILLGHDTVEREYRLKLCGREVPVTTMPIRFCKNVFVPYHFYVLLLNVLLLKMLPWKRFKNLLCVINPYVKTLLETDLVFDITGGDSFSDIYGIRRFIIGSLRKFIVLQFGKKLIMLPQTYGPFKSPIAKMVARYILRQASIIYSRDHTGVEYVHNLLNNCDVDRKILFAPDVAFVSDTQRPKLIDVGSLSDVKSTGSIVIGLNVSGLVFNGGYTRDNMFSLKANYRQLIHAIIEQFMQDEKTVILLIPHVFPPAGYEVESDFEACLKVYEELNEKYVGRIFLTRGKYNHNEVKYIIGMCDFFIGSRMHACIAALSQMIPVIGIAYSKKFYGVFDSIGVAHCVADARSYDEKELLEKVELVFGQKDQIREHLENVIPQVKKDILGIFKS